MAEPKRQHIGIEDRLAAARDPGPRFREPGGVAAVLHGARLQAGLGLEDVAATLRIQHRYLQAIEDGRFQDLPGPTYALGFVRAYAEFLQLDVKEVIRRFKDEARGLSHRQALVFPEPLQEGRFPGGAVLMVAIVLAAAVYGGWYYWEHRQLSLSDEVPTVPESIANLAASKPQVPAVSAADSAAAPSEAQASSGEPPLRPAAQGELPPAAAAARGAAATAAPGGQAAGATSAPPSSTGQPAAAANPAPASPPAAAGKLVLKPPEGLVGSDSARPPGAQASVAAPAAPAATAPGGYQAAPAAPPVPDQLAALKPGEPRVYGENNADSRVTLTARQDSWVQVRDKDSNVIWTRILRPGDSYRVPNQPGLSLVTGNAGALEVTVDGKPAPPLGGVGVVRRNITLDPDKLAAGTAPSQ